MALGTGDTTQFTQQKDSDVPAWRRYDNLTDIAPECRHLLETYADIKPDDVLGHALRIRDLAFGVAEYPCIGYMRFLTSNLTPQPFYDRVVTKLKQGATFMDAACCVGQELRYLISNEGIPSEQLCGFDIETGFFDVGFELFRDKDRFKGNLMYGNVMLPPEDPANALFTACDGSMDIVFCSSFLHLWLLEEQLEVAKRMVRLTRPKPGSVICGKQRGSNETAHESAPNEFGSFYCHDPESMKELWRVVGQDTGTEWNVEAKAYDVSDSNKRRGKDNTNDFSFLWFYCVRVG